MDMRYCSAAAQRPAAPPQIEPEEVSGSFNARVSSQMAEELISTALVKDPLGEFLVELPLQTHPAVVQQLNCGQIQQ